MNVDVVTGALERSTQRISIWSLWFLL
jgi:hypothetical protein